MHIHFGRLFFVRYVKKPSELESILHVVLIKNTTFFIDYFWNVFEYYVAKYIF